MSRLQPPPLNRKISRRVEFDPELENNVKSFIRVLVQEAVNCEVYRQEKIGRTPKKSSTTSSAPSKEGRSTGKGGRSSKNKTKAKNLPFWLWNKHR